jgi:hypothetical protein
MDLLSCKSPDMVEKEIWVYLLAYNLIRFLMAQAALLAGPIPRQLSFKHTVQIWVVWLHRDTGRHHPGGPAAIDRRAAGRPAAWPGRAACHQAPAEALCAADQAAGAGPGGHSQEWPPEEGEVDNVNILIGTASATQCFIKRNRLSKCHSALTPFPAHSCRCSPTAATR